MSDKTDKTIEEEPSEGVMTRSDMEALEELSRLEAEPAERSGFAARRARKRPRKIPAEVAATMDAAAVVEETEEAQPVPEARVVAQGPVTEKEPRKEAPEAAVDEKVVAFPAAPKAEEVPAVVTETADEKTLETPTDVDLSKFEVNLENLPTAVDALNDIVELPETVAETPKVEEAEEVQPAMSVKDLVATPEDNVVISQDHDDIVEIAARIQTGNVERAVRPARKRTATAERVRKCLSAVTYMIGRASQRVSMPSAAVAKKVGIASFSVVMLLNLDFDRMQSNATSLVSMPKSTAEVVADALGGTTASIKQMLANSLAAGAENMLELAEGMSGDADSKNRFDIAIDSINGPVPDGTPIASMDKDTSAPDSTPAKP